MNIKLPQPTLKRSTRWENTVVRTLCPTNVDRAAVIRRPKRRTASEVEMSAVTLDSPIKSRLRGRVTCEGRGKIRPATRILISERFSCAVVYLKCWKGSPHKISSSKLAQRILWMDVQEQGRKECQNGHEDGNLQQYRVGRNPEGQKRHFGQTLFWRWEC